MTTMIDALLNAPAVRPTEVDLSESLTGLVRGLQRMIETPTGAEVSRGLRRLESQGTDCLEALSEIAAGEWGRHPLARPFDTGMVISRALAFAEPVARVVGARRVLAIATDLPRVVGDPVAVEQAILLVLLASFRSATCCPLEVTVTASVAHDEGHTALRIVVSDDRPAPPLGVMPDLRRPGGGQGLDVARDVVLDHGGRLDLSAGPAGGYRVTILLPAASGDGELPEA